MFREASQPNNSSDKAENKGKTKASVEWSEETRDDGEADEKKKKRNIEFIYAQR